MKESSWKNELPYGVNVEDYIIKKTKQFKQAVDTEDLISTSYKDGVFIFKYRNSVFKCSGEVPSRMPIRENKVIENKVIRKKTLF